MELKDIREWKVDKFFVITEINQTKLFDEHNINVFRRWMIDDKECIIWELCGEEDEYRSNDDIMNYCKCFYDKNIFPDSFWVNYIIPSVNKIMQRNNAFVRWFPGYEIVNKYDKQHAIVYGDYEFLCGDMKLSENKDFKNLQIAELDKNGDICKIWAWADYNAYELFDTTHMKENLEKVSKYKDSK